MRLSFQQKRADESFSNMVPKDDGTVAVAGGGGLSSFNHRRQLASSPVERNDGGRTKGEED
eukprot:2631391-Prorocentrum_lima.AAC.1